MKIKILFMILCIISGLILAGCMKDTIEFNRQSSFQETDKLIQKINTQQKQNSYSSNYGNYNSSSNIDFGLKDIDFDLNIKFK